MIMITKTRVRARNAALYSFVVVIWVMAAVLIGCNAFATPPGLTQGYWTNWSTYKNYPIKNNLDLQRKLSVLNTLTYAFMFIDSRGRVVSSDTWSDINLGNLKAFSELTVKNHFIAIGGAGSEAMWLNALNNQTNFVNSLRNYITTYKINGVDLDYEPVGGLTAANMTKFISLVQKIKAAYPTLLIQFDITANYTAINRYGKDNWADLIKHVDYIHVMAYEMYGPDWYLTTELHSPLSGPTTYTAINAIQALKANGVPARKIILGTGAFAEVYKRSSGCGLGFKFRGGDFLAYKDLIKLPASPAVLVKSNGYISGVYTCIRDTVYTYDDPVSMGVKAKYVRDNNLGGIALWEVSMDAPMTDPRSLISSIGAK